MSDLSSPPAALLQPDLFAWPTPALPHYPAAQPLAGAISCMLEGQNGRRIQGQLLLFDPVRGVMQLLLEHQKKPMAVRLAQFRRLYLMPALTPLTPFEPAVAPPDQQTFCVTLHAAPEWRGNTVGHHEDAAGLYLFEPLDEAGNLRRWFVPRAGYISADIGLKLGEELVAQRSAHPEQIRLALNEQEALRARRLGDMLVVRQIITADELTVAIEQQARMPMVRIGEALTALGFITEVQLADALAQQNGDRSVPLGELLVKSGVVTRADLQTALARKMGYPLVDVLQFPADVDAVVRLPHAVAARLPALPLVMRSGRMVVALEDPSNRAHIDEIEFAAQCKAVPVLARTGVLSAAVDRAYQQLGAQAARGAPGDSEHDTHDASKLLASMEQVEARADHEDEQSPIEQSDNSLVRLINSMIVEAHTQGVSDIHIECAPGREKVRIRFRKDGALRPYLELPPNYRNALIARLKIMCDLDISERRKPQDGKINFAKFVQGMKLELRVATIPTHSNLEDAVLRLLASSKPIPLASLGLSTANLERFKAAARRPYGMLLCVGPTGSGKTTTLHSVLSEINTPERKIWTAEDPIEITQAGLRQVQVNPRIEWTFAKALRSFLRADPDVIMVGEIRDSETSQVAIEASLTGHLVLSTLHTNSAPETVTRLLDMGMDPFNFADALLAVLAQRLVKKLCSNCRESRAATAEEEHELVHDYLHAMAGADGAPAEGDLLAAWRQRFGGADGRLQHYSCKGCAQCSTTGFRGRAGIHELMTVSPALRHLIQTNTRADDLRRQAQGEGLRTLRQDGIEKVLAGVTSIEEVRANS